MDASITKPACKMLRDWLDVEGRKVGWVARQLGVDRATVSQWVNGHTVPQPSHRDRLSALTGGAVGVELWG